MQTVLNPQPGWRDRLDKWRQQAQKLGGFWFIGVTLLIVIVVHVFIARPYRVDGVSMQPTLHTDDHLIIWKAGHIRAWLSGSQYVPKRGEIIVLKSPVNTDVLIKRVVGLPNEQVVIRDGRIIVINEKNPLGFEPDLNTPADAIPPHDNQVYPPLAADEIFVVGDNRWPGQSNDSRYFSLPVKLENIIGDVVVRVLPLGRIDRF